ncbi:hypothetical protein GBN24_04305 [Plesiomonas shigelloides]|uniref:hypothetical protein n=1 Tax=Plesiomonas shigelloides TaxID=703 RepID=UPI001261F46B|nr:hypothetical protein [Plesiomonas shigelloides]KAB7693120.1 hypothetical protein GBN24_04305 [Plesiomonas shigelloides]
MNMEHFTLDSIVRKSLTRAFNAYLDDLDKNIKPEYSYLPYNFEFIIGNNRLSLGKYIIKHELQELTNIMNRWLGDLHRWHAWNNILQQANEDEKWNIQIEFIDALAHQCLLEPSAIRDRFTFVATNAFHQIRLASEDNYIDHLDGDPKHPSEKPIFLSRQKKEKRLEKVMSNWNESLQFLDSLKSINDNSYQTSTNDYRNRVNHAIAPRLANGMTQIVTRKLVQATRRTMQEDGSYCSEPITGKLTVQYVFGGTSPICLYNAWQLNSQQYALARECYNRYLDILKFKITSIARIDK